MLTTADEQKIVDEVLAGGGEMGALMRSMDWSRTLVGPVSSWPQSLRTAVSICLPSRYPMFIWWGPEYVMLYNDAYRPVLGATKHPSAMGQPGQPSWPEIWDIIGPMLDSVFYEGKSTLRENQFLLLDRNGYLEECYFTYAYSPIRDESGSVGGIWTAINETTHEVIHERRLRTLRELAAQTSEAHSIAEACQRAASTISTNNADLPFVLLYLLDEEGLHVSLAGTAGVEANLPFSPASLSLPAADIWPFTQVQHENTFQVVTGLAETYVSLPTGNWTQPPQQAVVLPLQSSSQEQLNGFLVAAVNPHRALDDDYQGFLQLVAGQVATALSNAQTYEAERHRAEALAELDRAKTVFFSNVSHEFRTPLTLMLAPMEDALGNTQRALADDALEMVYRNGLRLLRLVNTLLDFSRIEAGRIQASFEPVDIVAFTAELVSVFRSAAERAGLSLIVESAPLSDTVYLDREMWEKIVLNLLSNALKFTFQGYIRVSLAQVDQTAQLQVCDTGTGIPADELPHIFERFHRVKNARSRSHEGTGIGLSLVRELVQLHGGTIEVTSTVGQGSCFTVNIPLGSAHLPAERIGRARELSSTAIHGAAFVEEALRWSGGGSDVQMDAFPPASAVPATDLSASGPAVLVADDNADMLAYLQRLLSQHYQVKAVSDGLSALAAAQAQPPDLVLTDVMMPGLDGFELLKALRADPTTSPIPVIMLSARAGEEASVEGLSAGADDYLIKPFSARELLSRIDANLRLSRSQRTIREAERRQRFLLELNQELRHAASADEILAIATSRVGQYLKVGRCLYCEVEAGQEYCAVVANYCDGLPSLVGRYLIADFGPVAVETLKAGRTRVVADTQRDTTNSPEASQAFEDLSIRTLVSVPLVKDGLLLAALIVHDRQPRQWTAEAVTLVEQVIETVWTTLQRARAEQRSQQLLGSEQSARLQAEEAVQMRDVFLSVAAHELKTPVTSLRGFSQMLLRQLDKRGTPDPERLRQALNTIEQQSVKLTALVNQLLDVSRIEAGRLQLNPRQVNLPRLLDDVVATMRRTTQRHTIHVSAPEGLQVQADPLRIEQVLINLLDNAIKYSPDGGSIHVELVAQDHTSRIAVTDRGMGIPPERRGQLFSRFYQAHSGQNLAGLGLGLYISKQIVELHGGSIALEFPAHGGTCVIVQLPLSFPDGSDLS